MRKERIASLIKKFEEAVLEHYHWLHSHPELSGQEKETAAYIAAKLREMGLEPTENVGGYGVTAVIQGKGPGKCVGLRADIDALPITECTGLPFASQYSGVMHACGHDTHAAMLLGSALVLNELKDTFDGCVKLIFQPSEENSADSGAKRMIDEGALENPHVDVIYGMHMMPDVPKGKIATCAGPIMAQTCEMDFVIHGKSAHGATPHLGTDAVTAMGHLLTLFQTTVARSVDPCQQALITIGKVSAGTQRNILAESAQLEGIVRTFSNQVYERLEERIRADLRGIEAAFGVTTEFIKRVFYPCVENDQAEFERVKVVLGDTFLQAKPRMTAEDFSYYQLSVPGVFVFCGCMDENHKAPLHAAKFDFDEEALLPGLALFTKLVNAN